MASEVTRVLIESQKQKLAEQKALVAEQEAGLALLEGSLPAPPIVSPPDDPTVPTPPPPKPILDPLSGLPWPSGFGQCADQVAALTKMRGRPQGAYSGWTNFQAEPTNKTGWSWLRGGADDNPEKLGGVFAREGAYNFHAVAANKALLADEGILIWMFPMTPLEDAWNNNRRAGSWTKPQLWRRCGPDGDLRGAWEGHYTVIGGRLGTMLKTYKRRPDRFVLTLGWECTGTWYPWSVGPDGPAFKTAWRLAVDSARKGLMRTYPGAENQVRFEFRYAGNQTLSQPWPDLWPGRDHAAVLGASLHADVKTWSKEANWLVEMRGDGTDYKLGAMNALEFARLNGVKLGLDEWGIVMGGDDPKHPPDVDPAAGMRKVGAFLRENAAMIEHECFLYSSKSNLLGTTAKEKAGRTAYLETFGKPA